MLFMDYVPIIREQIIRDVRKLRTEQSSSCGSNPAYVSLGYLLNSHKGYPVFQEGEIIDGLAVKITSQRDQLFTIGIGAAKCNW